MTPTDRAALAARLREAVGLLAFPGGSAERDLLAAAAELERSRPLISWRVCPGEVEAVLAPFGVVWVGSRRAAMLRLGKFIAAGFDVAPLPEGG